MSIFNAESLCKEITVKVKVSQTESAQGSFRAAHISACVLVRILCDSCCASGGVKERSVALVRLMFIDVIKACFCHHVTMPQQIGFIFC